MLNKTTMRRLAFVRYLYLLGVEQSRQPEPMATASIFTFHDGIELFMQLAAEHLNLKTNNKMYLMDYWERFEIAGKSLSWKESVRSLNAARDNMKHHGIMPSKEHIEAFRASATSFFRDNTKLAFDVDYESVSMVNLVQCEEVRRELEEGIQLLDKDDVDTSLGHLALSFVLLIDDYETRKRGLFGQSPFFFGQSLTFHDSFFMNIEDRKFAGFVDKVKESIESLQSAVKIISLGIDYRRYVRFRLFTPNVARAMEGYVLNQIMHDRPITKEEAQYCVDFIIESAIQLQSFDFSHASHSLTI